MAKKGKRILKEEVNTNDCANFDEIAPAEKKLPPLKILLTCAACLGFLNYYHVSSMFENDRHFSHLSNLEREMTFRTEMGLYYSYYKTIVEAESFFVGINKLLYDNRTEYPDTINTLQRFNLYPEIILGGSYRIFESSLSSLGIPLPQLCWQVSRGGGLSAVVSCEGIGDPMYWYLSGVWVMAGFTAALIFLHGVQLSRSLMGGLIAALCFFFNHGEATRVQWTPPLRESFAFPITIALNIVVTQILRNPRISWLQPIIFGNLALNYLLCWQFGQFTIIANIFILYFMYSFRMIETLPMLLILLGSLYAFLNNVVVQFASPMLLTSPLAGVLIGVLLLYVFIEPILNHLPFPTNMGAQISFLFISSLATKLELSSFFDVEDDSHIVNVLRSKFSNYSDFHTLLYTCSPEFDFLPKQVLLNLTTTLLIPCVVLGVFFFLYNLIEILKKNLRKRVDEDRGHLTPVWSGVDVGILFNLFLLGIYFVMATLFMRLKLFFTSQLCVMSSLIAVPHFCGIKKKEVHFAILGVLISGMSIRGFANIAEQRSVVGEYSNPQLEEMINWINEEVGKEAVFAGPMPIMASVLLSTQRPVVNHPHYENAGLRERTKNVYSIFSRRPSEQVYETLLSMKVNYIIIEEVWCLRKSKAGCGMIDLWDVEEPNNRHRKALCPKLFYRSPAPFHKVFSNDAYVVLQVPSKYVEIPAPKTLAS